MSTGTRMALLTNILPLLFLAALVHSDKSTVPLRSVKISENVTYDCIDIYKQPGLDHLLLKTHKIQMKPTIPRHGSTNKTSNNKAYKKKVGLCLEGTVPILRNTKEFVTNAQLFAEKNIHLLTSDSPGDHVAGVRSRNGQFRGVEGWFGAYQLNVQKDQASYVHIYIGSGLKNDVNFIQAGFMINPGFFPDGRVWSYGFWKACAGFVQVSRKVPIVEPIDLKPFEPAWLRISIHQDPQTENWWLTQIMPEAPNEDIGYWPKELFNLLGNGASMVGAGGAVHASPSGLSPPMGIGKFPTGDREDSAIVTNIQVLNANYQQRRISYYPVEQLLDSPNCYGLRIGGRVPHSPRGYYFNYGGPGGNSCGI